LNNTAVLLAILFRKAPLIFLDAIFLFKFSLTKSFRNQIAIKYFCASLYFSHAKQIREDLNELD